MSVPTGRGAWGPPSTLSPTLPFVSRSVDPAKHGELRRDLEDLGVRVVDSVDPPIP